MAYPSPAAPGAGDEPQLAVLLLPRPLERFILREHAEDLLRAEGVVAVDPARVPYGAYGRLPELAGDALADRQAKRLVRALRRRGRPRVVVIFHPLQYPLARAVLVAAGEPAELWYGRWDRYEAALDATPKLRARLEELHEQAAQRSALTFVASEELARLERDAGRRPVLVPLAADDFPAPDPAPPGGVTVAVSLGHHDHRTDWALLRDVADRLGDRLVLLVVGERHDDEAAGDEDFAALAAHPSVVWLGRRSDEEAARIVQVADVGILPFRRHPFNEAGLPYRILKFARLGRRTITPDLAGVRTWERAVVVTRTAEEFAGALAEHAGARGRPDLGLRAWALAQTARQQDAPLWQRLREAGIDVRVRRG